jgi:S-adenosylhomocysteine hydrolase
VNSFTNQSVADVEPSKPADDKNDVFVTPKHLDEKAARLILAILGVRLTEPTKTQTEYRGVAGPHEAEQYRH